MNVLLYLIVELKDIVLNDALPISVVAHFVFLFLWQ